MAENEKKVAKAEKDSKKKEKKENKLKKAWKGFVSETKKVVWPSWKQVLKNTGIVIVIVLVGTLVLGFLDLAFRTGFDALVAKIVGIFTK